jgi:hypothetical protein
MFFSVTANQLILSIWIIVCLFGIWLFHKSVGHSLLVLAVGELALLIALLIFDTLYALIWSSIAFTATFFFLSEFIQLVRYYTEEQKRLNVSDLKSFDMEGHVTAIKNVSKKIEINERAIQKSLLLIERGIKGEPLVTAPRIFRFIIVAVLVVLSALISIGCD